MGLPKRRDSEEGVYAADFEAAAGLAEVCRAKREEREGLFRQLQDYWARLQEEQFFGLLLQTVHEAVSREGSAGKGV
jgi:hypothetical protein